MGLTNFLANALKGSRDLQAAVEAMRGTRAALLDQRTAVEAAPLPAKDVRPAVEGVVRSLAGDMRDRLHIGQIAMPGFRGALTSNETIRIALGVVALLDPKGTIAVLERLAIEDRGEAPGLTDAERAAKLGEIEQKLLGIEREEESLIEQAGAAGLTVQRRRDADPLVVLGLDREGR